MNIVSVPDFNRNITNLEVNLSLFKINISQIFL